MGLYQGILEFTDGAAIVNLRDGAGTTLTSTLNGAKQALDVNIANAMTIGVSDKTAFTYGTSNFQPVGGVFQDTAPTLTAGQSGAHRLTATRGQHVNLRTAAGAELGDSNVDGIWFKQGDGTNAQAFSATSEAFAQLRQGGNSANVTANNELLVLDTNAGLLNCAQKPATATLTQVTLAGAVSSAVFAAANLARKGFLIYNQTNNVVNLAFAATASSSAFTALILPRQIYEMTQRIFTGIISAVGVTGTSGNLVVTELS